MNYSRVGILAGYGSLPLTACIEFKKQNKNITVIAVKESCSTNDLLRENCDNYYEFSAGQAGSMLKAFKESKVEAVLLSGKVEISLLNKVKFDLKAVLLLAKVAFFSTDSINEIIIGELKRKGMDIISQKEAYKSLLAEKGVYSKNHPDEEMLEDIYNGFNFAKEIGSLDLGQSIVIENNRILALETAEGTDKTFSRGSRLGSKAVCVKTGKPNQDERFDLPTIGLDTLKSIHENGGKCLVVEEDETIIVDKDKCIDYVDNNNLIFICVNKNDIENRSLKKII